MANFKTITAAGLLGLSLLLGGCIEDAETAPKAPTAEETAAAEAKKEKEEKAAAAKKEEEKAAAAAAEAERKKTEALNQYKGVIMGELGLLSGYMQDFSEINQRGSENPFIMKTQEWQLEAVKNLAYQLDAINKIKQVKAPAEMQAIDANIKEAMSYYEKAVTAYPEAIDNMDVDLMNEIAANMMKGNELLGSAQEKMK